MSNPTSSENHIADIRALAGMALTALAVVVVILVLAWLGMRQVEATAARVWALVATILVLVTLPGVFVAHRHGYRQGYEQGIGHADRQIAGIDQGVQRVMGAAQQVADLRPAAIAATRRAVREDHPAPTNVLVLPAPPRGSTFSMRQSLDAGDDDVVMLE